VGEKKDANNNAPPALSSLPGELLNPLALYSRKRKKEERGGEGKGLHKDAGLGTRSKLNLTSFLTQKGNRTSTGTPSQGKGGEVPPPE